MKFSKLAFVALAAASFGLPAWAEDNGNAEGERGMFEHMDTDHDGFISKSEAQAAQDKRFSKMDTNGDGKISREEGKAFHQQMREKRKDLRSGRHK